MPNRIGPSLYGARATKEMLLQLRRANVRHGSIDLEAGEALLEAVIADPRARHGAMLALVEFLSVALEGSAIKPERWTPLEHVDPQHRDPGIALRKF